MNYMQYVIALLVIAICSLESGGAPRLTVGQSPIAKRQKGEPKHLTPLMRACYRGDLAQLQLAINHQPTLINCPMYESGLTALHWVALRARDGCISDEIACQLIDMLSDAGADCMQDNFGNMPLDYMGADTSKLPELKKALMAFEDLGAATPLMYACMAGDPNAVKEELASLLCDVNTQTPRKGMTALHFIVFGARRGDELNDANASGDPDLFFSEAIACKAIRMLMGAGAQLLKDHKGKTPLDRAIANKQDWIDKEFKRLEKMRALIAQRKAADEAFLDELRSQGLLLALQNID